MSGQLDRRAFLGTAAAGVMAGVGRADDAPKDAGAAGKRTANETVVVGVIGMGGRGMSHAASFARLPGAEVAYVCDVDERRTDLARAAVKAAGGKEPKGVGDLRRLLDDKAVDAVVIATCNHWHAPAALLAMAAGKHAYVEKPCSHNAREGELLVESARSHGKVCQMGNQRRSWPRVIEAIEKVRNGAIGRAYFAESFYNNARTSIGHGEEKPVPSWLDYDLWQGPAPRRPYRDNILHYNWHWFWHWGNGELGNNGIHYLDVCRWGLGVDYPTTVTSSGGRYRYDDDQETPDTHSVAFTFDGGKMITWQGLSCSTYRPGGSGSEIVFHGETGALAITGGGYTVYDAKGKAVEKVAGPGGDQTHQTNFLDAVRGEAKANSEILEGHRSTLLCHLGNIAQRTGRALRCDPKNGQILGDQDAMRQWSREYAPGWEPKV